jgi:hypothetical protein
MKATRIVIAVLSILTISLPLMGANIKTVMEPRFSEFSTATQNKLNLKANIGESGAGPHNHTTADGTGPVTNAEFRGFAELYTSATPSAPAAGKVRIYSQSAGGVARLRAVHSSGGDLAFFRDSVTRVRNNSGVSLAVGDVVYVTGSTGGFPTVAKARADTGATMPAVGIVTAAAANNAFTTVQFTGVVPGLNTTGFSEGNLVYVSPTTYGLLTATEPVFPFLSQPIGVVTKVSAGAGEIQVFVSPHHEGDQYGSIRNPFKIGPASGSSAVQLGFVNANTGTLSWTPTGTRTLTLPDTTGTLLTTTGDISSVTGTLDGDRLPAMSTTKKGGVPATGTPSGNCLKDDGTWGSCGTGGSGAISEMVVTSDSTNTGNTSFRGFTIMSSSTGTPDNAKGGQGRVMARETSWTPAVSGMYYWLGYDALTLDSVGLSNRAGKSASLLWNTNLAARWTELTTSANMAGSHTIGHNVKVTIPAGVGAGDGGVGRIDGIPTNPNYQEIASVEGYHYLNSSGHFSEGIGSYTFDNGNGASGGTNSYWTGLYSALYKNVPDSTYSNYGLWVNSFGPQQTTHAPDAVVHASGGFKRGVDLSVATFQNDAIKLSATQTIGNGTNSYTLADLASGGASVSDAVYGVGWNGVTTIAPSKNAVYDKIEALVAGGLTDDQTAAEVPVTTTNFSGLFANTAAYDTVQEVLDAVDNIAGLPAAPSGSDTQLQYNDAGTTAGAVGLLWDKTNSVFTANARSAFNSGAIADGQAIFSITGTLPTTPTATAYGIPVTVTTAGSANFRQYAIHTNLLAGYTGSYGTVAIQGTNGTVGTGTDPYNGTQFGNIGVRGYVNGTTTGANTGVQAIAGNGNLNVGTVSMASTTKASSTNVGVIGNGASVGASTINIGGYFTNEGVLPPFYESASLVVNNGAQPTPLFIAYDANTAVFKIYDGGGMAALSKEVVKTASATLGAMEVSGTALNNSGQTVTASSTLQLPTAAAGMNFILDIGTLLNSTYYTEIKAAASDKIYFDGTAGADNGSVRATTQAVGSGLVCRTFKTDAYDWICKTVNGAWTAQ